MSIDAKSIAFAVSDVRGLILYALGYVSSVGIIYLLCTELVKRPLIKARLKSADTVVAGRYLVSLALGSVLWLVLLAYPALLWIPISLFLIISLGATG